MRKNLTAVETVFRWAMKQCPKLAQSNPLDAVEKPSEPVSHSAALTRDRLILAMDCAEPWLRPIMDLAVGAGLRLKEAVALSWDDVDMTEGILRVSPDNKTGRPREVPIGAWARRVLEAAEPSRFVRGAVFLDGEGVVHVGATAQQGIAENGSGDACGGCRARHVQMPTDHDRNGARR